MPEIVLQFSSDLDAPPADVWAHAGTMEGVNFELGPWVRMTHPPGTFEEIIRAKADEVLRAGRQAPLAADTVPGANIAADRVNALVRGRVLFKSVLLAFGFLPFDVHSLALERVDPGHGFVEESTSWLGRRWHHERSFEPLGENGCRVTDRLTVAPRAAFAAPITRAVVRFLFIRRHRRLRSRFGGRPS
ncbi:hypothetical protein K8I61_11700 [bacterium]|nr:hypothetical protein [bacterium]